MDFSRNWSHTDLLNDFCNRTNLYPSILHVCSSVDYTYHFGLTCFNVLDYFIVSVGLFMNALLNCALLMTWITRLITNL